MAILEGFVALIDILGFQAFVRRPDFDARVQHYLNTLDRIIGRSGGGIRYYQASDSTILTTRDLGQESLRSLLEAVSAISFDALVEQDLPMRGGVASGRYAVQDAAGAGSGVAGPAVVDAYLTEQKQDWVGTMLSPSLFYAIPHLPELLFRPRWPGTHEGNREVAARLNWLLLAVRHPIPLHSPVPLSDPSLDGFAVIPKRLDTHTPEEIVTDLGNFGKALERLTLFAPDDGVQRKYLASMRFCSREAESWGNLAERRAWTERANPD